MSRGDEGYRIRMSGLDTLCGNSWNARPQRKMEYNAIFRFLFGDLTEAVVVALREAGVEIVDFNAPSME